MNNVTFNLVEKLQLDSLQNALPGTMSNHIKYLSISSSSLFGFEVENLSI